MSNLEAFLQGKPNILMSTAVTGGNCRKELEDFVSFFKFKSDVMKSREWLFLESLGPTSSWQGKIGVTHYKM